MTRNKRNTTVTEFVTGLAHTRKDEIHQLRDVVLAADVPLVEHVKWNAPSYCSNGDDRITFRLQPGDRFELIFHRGAKKRTDTDTFAFADPTALLRWLAPDRAIITIQPGFVDEHADDIQTLVAEWVLATGPR
jgi:hypothetical protein